MKPKKTNMHFDVMMSLPKNIKYKIIIYKIIKNYYNCLKYENVF
jgi:hypothetical protein